MGTYVGLHNRVYVAHLDLSGNVDQVDCGPLEVNMVPFTTFNDGGFQVVKPGIISGSGAVKGFQDFAADVLDDEINIANLGTSYPVSVVPASSTTVTAGDRAFLARGVLSKETPLEGAKGDAARFGWEFGYDTAFPFGYVAHPSAARTTTGTGTAVALAGPTASQKLYAAIHVTAYSGLTNVVFKIQSDDGAGFASATDRITFATVTGTTSEWASVAGNFSTETHLRASWTLTGVGSVTFAVMFGVI